MANLVEKIGEGARNVESDEIEHPPVLDKPEKSEIHAGIDDQKLQEISTHDAEKLQGIRHKLGLDAKQTKREKEPVDEKAVQQEWEIMCESVVKSFLNDEFLEYANRSPLEKVQEFLGSNYRNKPSHEMVFGSTRVPTVGLFEQLLPFFKKGVTTSREIFQTNPKIRSYFDVPQLWKEAEKRARERQK